MTWGAAIADLPPSPLSPVCNKCTYAAGLIPLACMHACANTHACSTSSKCITPCPLPRNVVAPVPDSLPPRRHDVASAWTEDTPREQWPLPLHACSMHAGATDAAPTRRGSSASGVLWMSRSWAYSRSPQAHPHGDQGATNQGAARTRPGAARAESGCGPPQHEAPRPRAALRWSSAGPLASVTLRHAVLTCTPRGCAGLQADQRRRRMHGTPHGAAVMLLSTSCSGGGAAARGRAALCVLRGCGVHHWDSSTVAAMKS